MAEQTTQLSVDIRPGDILSLGGVVLELEHKSGRVARLRVTAPRSVSVERVKAGSPAKREDALASS